VEVSAIDLAEIVVDTKLRFDLVQRLPGNVPGIQRLHGQGTGLTACENLAAGPLLGRLAVTGVAHLASNCASRLTISRADSAASAPLLPALVPERSMACSMESTVSTPK